MERALSTEHTPYINNAHFLQSDLAMSRQMVDMATLGLEGLALGIAASLFFRNKSRVVGGFLGFGVGYAVHRNMRQLCC